MNVVIATFHSNHPFGTGIVSLIVLNHLCPVMYLVMFMQPLQNHEKRQENSLRSCEQLFVLQLDSFPYYL